MSALYALLSFLAAITAVVAGYRVWEKRSTFQKSGTAGLPSESAKPFDQTSGSRAIAEETLTPPIETESAIAQPDLSQDLPQPSAPALSVPPQKVPLAPPIIPDPWLEEPLEEPVAPVAAPAIEANIPPSELDVVSQAGLTERILRLGRSGQINQVAYLRRYATHPDRQVRSAVAKSLGNLAIHWRGTVVEGMIPVLGKLSQDNQLEVRLAAVEALGKIQSVKVLPWLQRAQKDSNGSMRKAATTALQQLKLTYQPKAIVVSKPKSEKPKKR